MAGWVRARLVSRGREPATRRKRDNYITAHVSPDSTCYHRLHRAARGALAIPGPLRFLQEAVRQRHLVLRSEGKTRGSVRQPSGPSGELGGGGGCLGLGRGRFKRGCAPPPSPPLTSRICSRVWRLRMQCRLPSVSSITSGICDV